MRRGPGRPGDERGSGTMLLLAAMIVALMLAAALAVATGYRIPQAHARAAADAVALSGAIAVRAGGDACAAAQRAASANAVRLLDCSMAGDSVDHVVSVRVAVAVRAPFVGLPREVVATAHAGRLETASAPP